MTVTKTFNIGSLPFKFQVQYGSYAYVIVPVEDLYLIKRLLAYFIQVQLWVLCPRDCDLTSNDARVGVVCAAYRLVFVDFGTIKDKKKGCQKIFDMSLSPTNIPATFKFLKTQPNLNRLNQNITIKIKGK